LSHHLLAEVVPNQAVTVVLSQVDIEIPQPAPPRPEQTRYFGTVKLNPDFYARDFGKITSEVLHLAAVDGVQLRGTA
ncbi:hypothetical protein PJN38_29730, partial [Mycobacterium kansasii]